jgi:hypothetical protein
MSGRETTVASVPSDNATFDEDPGAAKPVLHRDIEAHLPNLRRYARSLTRDAVAADDLVQECNRSCPREGSSLASGHGSYSVIGRDPPQPILQPGPPSHP